MDMEKMIKDCEKKRREGESIVFAIGAGRIYPMFGKKKAMKQAFEFISNLDGFIGVHPIELWKTLLIFDSLNHAKSGRNQMIEKGIQVGQVVPILIPTAHLKGGNA